VHPQHGGLAVGGGVNFPDQPVVVDYRERKVAPAALGRAVEIIEDVG